MARSSYVYIVFDGFNSVSVQGAFTVKHEMITAVHRAIERKVLTPAEVRVYRTRDGGLEGFDDVSEQFLWAQP